MYSGSIVVEYDVLMRGNDDNPSPTLTELDSVKHTYMSDRNCFTEAGCNLGNLGQVHHTKGKVWWRFLHHTKKL